MNVVKHIDSLGIDQLSTLSQIINDRIAEKKAEKMRVIWVKSGGMYNDTEYFGEDDYLLAVRKLLEDAEKNVKDGLDKKDEEACCLRLDYKCVPASEYGKYFK